MKNHVNYETAVRLKEAGFPQPEPESGQFWYLPTGANRYGIFCCYGVDVSEKMPLYLFATSIKKDIFYIRQTAKWQDQMDNCFFAPTAADILRELPVGFCIVNFGKFGFGAEFEKHEYIRDQNPPEAAAQAFLNLKAKQ